MQINSSSKKILYIFPFNINDASGVTNKVKTIINCFKQNNINYTLFAISDRVKQITYLQNQYLLPITFKNNWQLVFNELDNFIQKNAFDIYFYRNSFQNKFLFAFLKKHPHKITLEHNTKELIETINGCTKFVKNYSFKLSPSYYKLLKNSFFTPVITTWHYGKKNLQLAKQGVAVTNEICEYQKKIVSNYKCSVISNGIDVSSINFCERSFKNGDTLKLIMLVGQLYDWHGLDLILESFKNYMQSNIQLTIIGNIENAFKKKYEPNSNIIFVNYLQKNELTKYINTSHIGLGSFALFKIKLAEASVLKVREYLAAGLPVFIGYNDTDIMANEILKKYSYQVNLKTSTVNWEQLYQWAIEIYQQININKIIRNEALKQIDVSTKVNLMMQL